MADRRSPIERMIDGAGMRCTVCAAAAGSCGCWSKCRCGWSVRTGADDCRNPVHAFEKAANELAADIAVNVIGRLRSAYPEPMKHASGGFAKTLRAAIIDEAKRTIMVVYQEDDKARKAHA